LGSSPLTHFLHFASHSFSQSVFSYFSLRKRFTKHLARTFPEAAFPLHTASAGQLDMISSHYALRTPFKAPPFFPKRKCNRRNRLWFCNNTLQTLDLQKILLRCNLYPVSFVHKCPICLCRSSSSCILAFPLGPRLFILSPPGRFFGFPRRPSTLFLPAPVSHDCHVFAQSHLASNAQHDPFCDFFLPAPLMSPLSASYKSTQVSRDLASLPFLGGRFE